jgi:hypothetical protein
MDTKDFLDAVLGDDGHYCVFAAKDGKRVQKFYTTREEVIEAATHFDSEGYETYFALATFCEAGSRKATNIKYLKSFFLDLDCGPTKDYPTKRDALISLKEFVIKLELPKPIVLDSGRGIHAYFPLTEQILYVDWLPVAEALKRACADNGLLADPAVTADGARILRVPNTHNYKDATPKEVKVLTKRQPATGLDYFASLVNEFTIKLPTKIPEGANTAMDNLLGNIQGNFKKILDRTIKGTGCEQLKYILLNQENMPEPMWRAGLSIAKFCVDAEQAAKALSKRHPDYTWEATQEKMELIKGPYLCSSFDEFNPNVCEHCPHYGKIKSPVSLGKEIQEATEEDNIVLVQEPAETDAAVVGTTYTIPSYPKPYFRGKVGGVYRRSVTADGDVDEKLIYHNDIYVLKRLRDPELGESAVIRLHLPKDGVQEFMMPLMSITSREEFRRQMSIQGVVIAKVDDLMGYIMSWITELQATTVAESARRQFGWLPDRAGFVIGDKEYTAAGVEVNHPTSSTSQYFKSFTAKGTLDGWKEAMAFYNRKGMELHQLVVCAQFGSALVEFIPNVSAAGLHIYSKDSGLGKTTALWAGASIWGDPKTVVVRNNDTQNFTFNRAEVFKNIPLCVDEITNVEPKTLAAFAYLITGGYQKGRMSTGRNEERFRGEEWKNLVTSTGNKSIIESISLLKAAPLAEAQRILEVRAQKYVFDDKKDVSDFNKKLSSNFGHAGPIFVSYILRNQDKVQTLVDSVKEEVDKICGLDEQNRFWSTYITCTIAGCILANKLELIPYDHNNILDFCKAIVAYNRQAMLSSELGVDHLLNNYLYEKYTNVLIIRSTDDLRKETHGNGLDTLVIADASPRGSFVARYEPDVGKLYLLPKPLKHWCINQQISYGSLVEDLIKNLKAKRSKVRLTKGTSFNLPPTDAIVVDYEWKTLDASSQD